MFYRGGETCPNLGAGPDASQRASHLLVRPQPLEHRLVPDSDRPRLQPGGPISTHTSRYVDARRNSAKFLHRSAVQRMRDVLAIRTRKERVPGAVDTH